MLTQSAKAKGRKLQNWVVDTLISEAGKDYLTKDDVSSRSMGANGEDILMSPKARDIFPVSIECKSVARFIGYTFLEQAEANAPEDTVPIVVIKANRKEPLVIVDAGHYFALESAASFAVELNAEKPHESQDSIS